MLDDTATPLPCGQQYPLVVVTAVHSVRELEFDIYDLPVEGQEYAFEIVGIPLICAAPHALKLD